jgi:hypothetical protein
VRVWLGKDPFVGVGSSYHLPEGLLQHLHTLKVHTLAHVSRLSLLNKSLLKDCIMTGENFGKRGGIGPSVCYLCLKDEESTQHLLLNCKVSLYVLMEVCIHLKIQAPSICMNVSDFLK